MENLVFLLKLVLTQAKDQIHAVMDRRARSRDHPFKESRKGKHYNTTNQFDYSVGLLVDVVRRDRETASEDLVAHPVMAKMLLQWLYSGRSTTLLSFVMAFPSASETLLPLFKAWTTTGKCWSQCCARI